jgi:hypothetical protein
MKITTAYIVSALALFFAPIAGIIILVAMATLIDSVFGVWRAKKLGEEIKSKTFRHGFVPKVLSYCGAVMLLYTSDYFIINELMHLALDFDYLATKIVSLILISIEVKSMDESFTAVKGYSFLKKIIDLIIKAKNIKNKIKKDGED